MESNAPVPYTADFSNLDIGSPQLAGSAKQVEDGWDIVAGGADIWEKSDQFHFVHKQVSGDFDIAVRVEAFTPAHLYSKAGIMIRETLSPDSAHLMFVMFSTNSRGPTTLAWRAKAKHPPLHLLQTVQPQLHPQPAFA
jgi:hypothetical protein